MKLHLDSLSENSKLLGVAWLNLNDLLNINGVLSRGLRDISRSILPGDGRDVDNIFSESRVTNRRLTAIDKGLGLTTGRVLGVGKDLTHDLVSIGELDLMFRGTLVKESSEIVIILSTCLVACLVGLLVRHFLVFNFLFFALAKDFMNFFISPQRLNLLFKADPCNSVYLSPGRF